MAITSRISDLRPEEVGFDEALFRRGASEECDFCVVGTGAGGAPIAARLAEAGFSVVMLEEGPALRGPQFVANYWRTAKAIFRDVGMMFAAGEVFMPILQGCCVGGTTTINSAISWRLPPAVWEDWRKRSVVASPLTEERLEGAFRRIEEDLHIRPTQEEVWGENNRLMALGAKKLGWAAGPTRRNEDHCDGLSLCNVGCPRGRKLSMEATYVPRALARGARLHPLCRAERILLEGGRAVGVTGRFLEPHRRKAGGRMTVRARRGVVVSAGAIHSPLLLLKSGVGGSEVGRHFMGHPGVGIAGRFKQEVRLWEGATQGYEVTEFQSQGFKPESLAIPPELLLVRIPGSGRTYLKRVEDLPHLALLAVETRAQGEGRVRPGLLGPRISYRFLPGDVRRLFDGIKALGRLLFAAGAERVYPGVVGFPDEVRDPKELDRLDDLPPDIRRLVPVSTHLFSTCRMGTDPRTSVVGPDGQVHGTPGLYVSDGSSLPSNLGVNPQETIMAFSHALADHLSGA